MNRWINTQTAYLDCKTFLFSIFQMATHPVILEVSRKLLGDNCRLSSLAANSVLPGMGGQVSL